MSKTIQRMIVTLLAAVILISALPVTGFALTAEEALDYLSYEITDGEVTITDCDSSASGEMVIPATIEGYPVTSIGWGAFSGCSSLTSITIPDSVTRVGDYAFQYCRSLKGITIPNSVTSIGDGAFEYCSSLTGITIPDSVTSIGDGAFEYCSSLTNVTIGNSVTSIGDSVFYCCSSLTGITIPDSVTSIGIGAFYFCSSLTSITVDKCNEYYSSDEYGVLYNKDKTELMQYPVGNSREAFTIPDSVTSIGEGAFYECDSLTSIAIPGNVTSIGDSAFSRCSSLTSITVDESNKYYCSDEFGVLYNKYKTQLILYPVGNSRESFAIPDSVTSIGNGAFNKCSSLTSITIPDSVTRIGIIAFSDCSRLATITIPNSVTSIGFNAFYGCISLKNVTIGNGVKSMDGELFGNCNSLTSITVDESNGYLSSDEYGVLYNKHKTQLILYPVGNSRESFAIPDSVTSICDSAFWECSSLTSITIPDSVTSIGYYAFSGCSSLTSITVDNSNMYYCSDEYGVLYNKNKTEIIQYPIGNLRELFTVPDSVKSIGDYAFGSCSSLTSITIPDSVTSIGWSAFKNCSSLTSVIIPDRITYIEHYAFSDCNSLQDVYYAGSEEKWQSISIYYGNECLTNATIHYNYVVEPETVDITDESTGIQVSVPSGTFDGDVTLKVEEVLSGSSFDIIGKVNGKLKTKVFTIETYVDGQSVQPNGDVTVRIPVPDGFTAEKCKLYYLNTSSKNPEEIAFRVEDGYIVFTTNHFSDWAIIQTADMPTVSVNDIGLNYKKSAALNPSITVDENASYTVTYTSSNPSVARVDENGKVYGAKKGSAEITVTVTDEYGNTVSDTCKVNVTYAWWQWIIVIVLFGWIWY